MLQFISKISCILTTFLLQPVSQIINYQREIKINLILLQSAVRHSIGRFLPIFPKLNGAMQKHKHSLPLLVIAVIILSANQSARASDFFDYHYVMGFYGHSNWTNIGPEPSNSYKWVNISYAIGKDITPWLSLETAMGPGYIRTADFNKSATLEWRMLMDLHKKYLFFKLGAGAAHLLDSSNMPDLSSSNFFSLVSCQLGLRYRPNDKRKNQPEFKIGYSVEHLSDPFKGGDDGDSGLNVGTVNAQLIWQF